MESESKPWLQSKTIIGAGVSVAASILHMTGLSISDADIAATVDAIVTIAGAIGGLLAIYGRVVASKPLH